NKNILHANFARIHAEPLGNLIQLLFAGPGALGDAVAAVRPSDGLVGVNRVAVDFDVWNSIGAGCRETAANANRRTFFGVGTGALVDRHFARHQSAVFFYAGF